VAVDVSSLRRGKVLPVRVELPPPDGRNVRVFFVRQPGGHVDAFLGVSTHLGCALLIPQDARFGRGFTEGPGMAPFQDPCGGSTYSLDGECVGGPCPRGLDRYVVRRTDHTASIDLTRLVAGPVAARFSR
jgi:Rieske Fe-S protein